MNRNVALTFAVPLGRYQLKNDRLHRRDIAKSNFRNVKSTDDVSPSLIICFLKRPITRWTQLASNFCRSLLWFAFSTIPWLEREEGWWEWTWDWAGGDLPQLEQSQFHNKLDEQRRCNFDHHNRRGGFQTNPFRRNIRNIHRPSPSFWPAVIVNIFAFAHAQLRWATSLKRNWNGDLLFVALQMSAD